MIDIQPAPAILRALRAGFLRRHRPLSENRKEWLHFCLVTRELFVLVNFSLTEKGHAGEIARITCIVGDGAWHGDVETVAAEKVYVRPGRIHLEFDQSYVRMNNDGVLSVRVVLPRRQLELELAFTPASSPLVVNNVSTDGRELIHWFVVPRMLASGTVRTSDRCRTIDRAPAYHDHNWGTFCWGGDFSWIWGYAHPREPENPWSVTFDRLMNRARNVDRARALMVWRDGREHRLFRDQDLSISAYGMRRARASLKVPRPLGLLLAGDAADIPERLVIAARSRNDALEAEVVLEEGCQILVPDDHGSGLTVIHELICTVVVEGRIRGEAVHMDGRGIFEFLGF